MRKKNPFPGWLLVLAGEKMIAEGPVTQTNSNPLATTCLWGKKTCVLPNQSAKKFKIFLVTALVTMKVLDLSTSTGQLLSELSCPKQLPTGVSSHP